ncbi:hypothetical protein DO944_00400 [Microbacterium sp. SMR1]|nr:hypothetical protein DO944_00400 [Microbacterium sp. SMR1]
MYRLRRGRRAAGSAAQRPRARRRADRCCGRPAPDRPSPGRARRSRRGSRRRSARRRARG